MSGDPNFCLNRKQCLENEARIRELEAENKLWRDGEKAELREVQNLMSRIRELEAKSEEWELSAIAAGKRAELLTFRIAKAREILALYLDGTGSCGVCVYDIREALAALKGK